MLKRSEEFRDKHNQNQLDYFNSSFKRNMQPQGASPYVQRQIDEVIDFAGLTKEQRILDVGCGIGRYTLPLAERGYQIEGLDLSQHLLDQLHEHDNGRFNIPVYAADILDPPENLLGQFDVLVGFFTLHHLHDIPACYQSMKRFLKPGGRIVFLEPNAFNPLYYIQITLTPTMTWRGDGGIIYMRKGYIFEAMQQANMIDLRIKRFGFFPPMIVNRRFGQSLERPFEAFPLWHPLLPFQIFMGTI